MVAGFHCKGVLLRTEATSQGNLCTIGEMQNPVRKVMHKQDGLSRKVVGSNPGAGNEFFLGISVDDQKSFYILKPLTCI